MARSALRLAVWGLGAGLLWPAWGQGVDETPKPFAPPGTPARYPRTRGWDLRHTRLEVRFDWKARKVFGVATLTLAPLASGTQSIELDSADMVIRQIHRQGGAIRSYRPEGERLTVELDPPAAVGQEVVLIIGYEATPKKGLYFVGPYPEYPERLQLWSHGQTAENHHWFPTWDAPDDKATSEMLATVPAEMTAVANGQLIQVTTDLKAGTRTFHWRTALPHSTYLISIAVGRFEEHREPGEGVPILYYVPRGEGAKVRPTFEKTADMLRFFAGRLGVPYPWEKYAQAAMMEYVGGMENVSATTLGEQVLQDQQLQLDYNWNSLIAHELAHQWFGNLVTCRDWSELWLNESFATFMEAVYREHDQGEDAYLLNVRGMVNRYLSDARRYRRPLVTRVYANPEFLFDNHAYAKGGAVLHSLRRLLGEDPFWRGLREYLQKHRFQSVHTHDLMRAMEEASGHSLGEFFQQWVYSPGHPQFQVSWQWDHDRRMARLQVRQAHKTEDGTPLFHMPLKLLFEGPWGREEHQIEVREAASEYQFKLPDRPQMVLFDSRHGVLKSLEFTKATEEWIYQAEHGPDAAHRLDAVEALEKMPAQEGAWDALARALKQDRVITIRAAAAKALGALKRSEVGPSLVSALSDTEARVRASALGALQALPAAASPLPVVRWLAQNDPSVRVRAAAVRLIAKHDPKGAHPLLTQAIDTASLRDSLRSTALELLAERQDAASQAIVLAWAQPGRPLWARLAAVRGLGKAVKGRAGRDLLLALLEHPMASLRTAALDALAARQEPEVIPVLQRLASAQADPERSAALRKTIDALRPPANVTQFQERIRQLEMEHEKLRERLDKAEGRAGRSPREAR